MTGNTWMLSAALVVTMLLSGCRSQWHVTKIDGGVVVMDSVWDVNPDKEALALLQPYKMAVDSVMDAKLGESEMVMTNARPEDKLQNLVADVIREAAAATLGHPADMGLMNVGGLRNVMPEGDVLRRTVFEILPFENALCVLTLDGATLKELFAAIAARGGEGVSGVNMTITSDGKLLDCSVAGEPVDENRLYTVATIDYLAGGNDGMTPLTRAKESVYPKDAVLRDVFIDYLAKLTAEGKKLSSAVEGRVVVK